MFFDPSVDFKCLIDRTSGGGKTLRRVFVMLQDGAALICKTNGSVCRIFHVSQITHLIHSPSLPHKIHHASSSNPSSGMDDGEYPMEGVGGGGKDDGDLVGDGKSTVGGLTSLHNNDGMRGGGGDSSSQYSKAIPARHFLIRIANEHDLLFTIVSGAGDYFTAGSDANVAQNRHLVPTGGSSQPGAAHVGLRNEGLQLIDTLIRHRSALGGLQLHVVERMDADLLRQAANVVRPQGFVKPKASSVANQLFVPILFDDFSILSVPSSSSSTLNDPFDVITDASFVTLLQRAIVAHPMSASKQPQLQIETPPPFKHFQVSETFFTAFCVAFDENLPLTIHVRSHMPNMTTFRASDRFWRFITHTLRVTRPPEDVFSLVTTTRVEAHVEGQEHHLLTCTNAEWNDAIIAWENSVRSSTGGRVQVSANVNGATAGRGGRGQFAATTLTGNSAAQGTLAADLSTLGGDETAASNALFWRSFVAELETGRGSIF